ncbi:MAG: hypothetical protein GY805_06865, partial [Chloroflexi bacterium]|nr:hypothetical protein [Chloroflexota bacterium]
SNAKLYKADLEGANLERVKLKGAFLKRANLHNANVTIEQLATVGDLENAIMPDGRKYEVWEPIIPTVQPIELPSEQIANAGKGQNNHILLLLAGGGIAIVSGAFSFWASRRWRHE